MARRQVDLRGLDRQPCGVCWPRTTSNDAWSQLAREVERQGDSDFEVTFVEQVLRHVRGLNPSDVATQVPATGRSGSRYWIDFVLSPPNGIRLAVEIDGRDKDPGNRTPDEVLRAVESKRADLASAWQLLNFRNDQVAGRSSECAEAVRGALFISVPGRAGSPTREAIQASETEGAWVVQTVECPGAQAWAACRGRRHHRHCRSSRDLAAPIRRPLDGPRRRRLFGHSARQGKREPERREDLPRAGLDVLQPHVGRGMLRNNGRCSRRRISTVRRPLKRATLVRGVVGRDPEWHKDTEVRGQVMNCVRSPFHMTTSSSRARVAAT